jgi:hypothetical protein
MLLGLAVLGVPVWYTASNSKGPSAGAPHMYLPALIWEAPVEML